MGELDADTVAHSLKSLGEGLQGAGFSEWRAAFVQQHVGAFDFAEENRLVYTEIHKSYVQGLEEQLSRLLPDGVAIEALEASLMQRPHLVDELDEASSSAVKLLLEAADFVAFREMMLYEKQKGEQAETLSLDRQQGCTVPSIDGIVDKCLKLAAVAEADGWVTVLQNDWIIVAKKDVPEAERSSPHEVYLRGIWTMNLSVVEGCDMMMTFDERRKGWDSKLVSAEILKGSSWSEDDIVVSSEINFGFLLHAAGVPRRLCSRLWRRWNHPCPGVVTSAMIPWCAETDSFDPSSALLTLKVTTIGPHPEDPKKCIMTTVESNKFGRMPKWMLSMLMSVTAPQLMKGLEGRYIASSRRKGDVVDVTPPGFCAAAR